MPYENKVDIYIPNLDTWDGCIKILQNTEGNFECDFDINVVKLEEGIVFSEDGVVVKALPNNHIADRPKEAFSFVFETDETRIIYSGDVAHVSELSLFLEDGCDLLIMETGHHSAEEICCYISENNYDIGKIIFMHHGRKMLSDRKLEVSKAKKYFKNEIIIADDAKTYVL